MHRKNDEHKCWKSIAVKAFFCKIYKYKDNYKYKYKNLRLHIRMAAITQNCKEAAAGARLLGEIKQTKEKLWKYQHFGGGQKIENGNYFGREKAKIPTM